MYIVRESPIATTNNQGGYQKPYIPIGALCTDGTFIHSPSLIIDGLPCPLNIQALFPTVDTGTKIISDLGASLFFSGNHAFTAAGKTIKSIFIIVEVL